MLFREFAAECMELAQSSPEKQALYMKMASVWFQMAQRWEKLRKRNEISPTGRCGYPDPRSNR